MDLYIQFLGASGAVIGSTRQQSFVLTETRQRYSVSSLCPTGGVRARAIWRGHNSGIAGDIDLTIDNAQFEQGPEATEYQFTGLDMTGSRNPTADPNEHFPDEIWFIERKVAETKEMVEFELATAIDLNGEVLPGRQIMSNVCTWLLRGGYRGPYCSYTGSAYFDINDNPVSDPGQDVCAGLVRSCKRRFGESNELPYGGFPAAGLVRT
ncbi:phage minor tail protein L [Stenotrophomonas maltophilia]|nr:phage minor tail protein L [Stenotrophomonas maltophilia]